MSDTKRCPMCGKSNPVNAEVCPHCQAQLKPIVGGTTPPESPVSPSEERDAMDWLRNLSGADESPPAESELEDDELLPQEDDDPFLLNRINLSGSPSADEETPKQTPAFPPADDQEEEGNADWLRILEESSIRKENAAHSLPEEDTQDLDTWLENLGSVDTPPAAPQPETPATPTPPRKLTERLKEESLAQEEPNQGDWMNALREKSTGETAPKPGETTELSSIFTSSSVDKTGSLMGWLDDETPFSDDVPAIDHSELPDWLKEETPNQDIAPQILPDLPADVEQPAQAAELPDWLRDMAPAESGPSTSVPAASLDMSGQEDFPAWLQDETGDHAAGMLDFSSDEGDDMSDLLSGFHAEESPAEESPVPSSGIFSINTEEKESSPFPFGGDLPVEKDDSFDEDILIGAAPSSNDGVPFEENAILKKLSLGNGEDLPDWLSEKGPSADENESPAVETVPFSASPFTDEISSGSAPFDSSLPFEDDGDLPDWLKSDSPLTKEESSAGEEAPAFSASPFLDNLVFEDTASNEDSISFGDAAPAGDEHPFAADNLPDWLESEEARQIIPEQPAAGDTADNLSPAQLPGWLAAMRPVESVAVESDGSLNEHIEKSGPLAGLRGVLPVDSQAIKYRKPPVYSAKLNVSETQAAHAGLMEDILQRESKPSEAKRVGTQGSKRLMQLVVALVLIVVLIFFRSAGSVPDIAGRPYLSPFVTSFFNEIEILAPESPVLLAVDYEPGYSGEMKAASNAAIQRLMSKQQRIAVISTVPAGSALAEDLLLQAYSGQQASGADYMNTHTINLGYLPGGITSLREFALRPQQAARYGLTAQHDGLIPWDHPALTGVSVLTDFAAVIVITDSVDSGRAWVEQVQPSLGSTPMLLISSAQSAPIMEAYVQSGQLSGMLSGLGGSVSYENLLQQPGTGHTYWVALQGGMAVVVALILVGILLELFVSLVASRRTQSEA